MRDGRRTHVHSTSLRLLHVTTSPEVWATKHAVCAGALATTAGCTLAVRGWRSRVGGCPSVIMTRFMSGGARARLAQEGAKRHTDSTRESRRFRTARRAAWGPSVLGGAKRSCRRCAAARVLEVTPGGPSARGTAAPCPCPVRFATPPRRPSPSAAPSRRPAGAVVDCGRLSATVACIFRRQPPAAVGSCRWPSVGWRGRLAAAGGLCYIFSLRWGVEHTEYILGAPFLSIAQHFLS
jgi:hypothetical protein